MSRKSVSVSMGIAALVVLVIGCIVSINAGCVFQLGYSPSSYTTICTLSGNKLGRLDWQSDGNLVIYNDFNGAPAWSTSTSGNPNAQLTFQSDGNLVIKGGNNNLLWSSGTAGRGKTLNFQDDGNLVIYDASNAAVWASGIFLQTPPGAMCVYRRGYTFLAFASCVANQPARVCHLEFLDGKLSVGRDDYTIDQHQVYLWRSPSSASRATFQSDGNLVGYNANNGAVWSTSTTGTGKSLIFKDNCDLVVYNAAGQTVWHSASVLATCDCNYHSGGCTISQPAPTGYKCKCSYGGFWSCSGEAQQCANGQLTGECDGACMTKTCCIAGGGDCGGYGN